MEIYDMNDKGMTFKRMENAEVTNYDKSLTWYFDQEKNGSTSLVYKSQRSCVCGEHFEIIDDATKIVNAGYCVWPIGRAMPTGYLLMSKFGTDCRCIESAKRYALRLTEEEWNMYATAGLGKFLPVAESIVKLHVKGGVVATLYKANGGVENVTPENGTDFQLEELQAMVGGYIEIVYLPSDKIAVCNEEGLLMELPFNTPLYNDYKIELVGDVLVCNSSEVK